MEGDSTRPCKELANAGNGRAARRAKVAAPRTRNFLLPGRKDVLDEFFAQLRFELFIYGL